MAQITKIKRSGLGMYFNHCNRKQDDGIDRSNECIDNERTHLNYHFKEGTFQSYKERLDVLFYPENTRNEVITFASCVVSLPKNVKEGDEKKFFESCYDFLCNDYGYDNVINAVVHMDETTPHMHLGFIPAIAMEDKEKSTKYQGKIDKWIASRGIEPEGIVSARDVLDIHYFRNFHPRLYKFVEQSLGYEVEILNGATANGNKTILELKNQEKEKELQRKQEEIEKLNGNIQIITRQLDALGIDKKYMDMGDLLSRLEAMQEENNIYRDLLMKNQIVIPRETVNLLHETRSSYHIGNVATLTGDFNPKKKYVLVETYKNIPRPLPLDDYIANNPTLIGAIHYKKPKAVLEEQNMDEKYLIVPTDSIADTIAAMYYIKEFEDKYNSLSMYQFSNDPDNLVREILQNSKIDVEYFLNIRDAAEMEKDKLKQIYK